MNQVETQGSGRPLWWGDFLLRSTRRNREGNGNPLRYSCLENPMDRRKESGMTERLNKKRSCWPFCRNSVLCGGITTGKDPEWDWAQGGQCGWGTRGKGGPRKGRRRRLAGGPGQAWWALQFSFIQNFLIGKIISNLQRVAKTKIVQRTLYTLFNSH